jgi:hypothetical protein
MTIAVAVLAVLVALLVAADIRRSGWDPWAELDEYLED